MDISALPEATIACLAAASEIYVGAKVLEISPISGGYSRLTFKYSIRTKNGDEDIVLQYVPLGATGIVRIDRMVENDILVYLSENEGVNSPKLIASDVKGNFFDNAAFILASVLYKSVDNDSKNDLSFAFGPSLSFREIRLINVIILVHE